MRLYSERSIAALRAEIEKTSPMEWAICKGLVLALVVSVVGFAYVTGEIDQLFSVGRTSNHSKKPQITMAGYYHAVYEHHRQEAVRRAMAGSYEAARIEHLKTKSADELEAMEKQGGRIPASVYERAHRRDMRKLLQEAAK
jgi:hypothetical protein